MSESKICIGGVEHGARASQLEGYSERYVEDYKRRRVLVLVCDGIEAADIEVYMRDPWIKQLCDRVARCPADGDDDRRYEVYE